MEGVWLPPSSQGPPMAPAEGEGGRGFGWDPPSSQGPPMVPAEGGPENLKFNSSSLI